MLFVYSYELKTCVRRWGAGRKIHGLKHRLLKKTNMHMRRTPLDATTQQRYYVHESRERTDTVVRPLYTVRPRATTSTMTRRPQRRRRRRLVLQFLSALRPVIIVISRDNIKIFSRCRSIVVCTDERDFFILWRARALKTTYTYLYTPTYTLIFTTTTLLSLSIIYIV